MSRHYVFECVIDLPDGGENDTTGEPQAAASESGSGSRRESESKDASISVDEREFEDESKQECGNIDEDNSGAQVIFMGETNDREPWLEHSNQVLVVSLGSNSIIE